MYTYKDSGRDGYDILVVTKQGHEKSGLPCGVVIVSRRSVCGQRGRLRYSGRVIAAENHCFFGRDASLSVSTKKERRNNMSRKRKSAIPTNAADQKTRLYVGTIHTRDLRPATPARFLPISGFGVHGDTKYNRRRQKRADRMEIAAWKEKEE